MESAIRVDANIKLQIAVFSTTTVSLNVSYRERINGVTKQPREANIASSRITTDAAANYFYYQFYGDSDDVSELLNVAVGLATSGVQRGQCFVRVGLTIGGVDGYSKDAFQILFSDYVTSNSYLAYPGTSISDSLSGKGNFVKTIPADPGAGNNYGFTINPNLLYKLISVKFLLTCAAVAATRKSYITLIDTNNANVFTLGCSTGSLIISESAIFNFSIRNNIQNFIDPNADGSSGAKKVFLEELCNELLISSAFADNFIIGVANFDAADELSLINIYTEEWIKA